MDPAALFSPTAARARRRPKASSPGLYRVAAGSRSRACPEAAAPARKKPSWSGRGDTASCSRPGHRLHLFGQPLPDGDSGHCSHLGKKGIRPARPLKLLLAPAPPTGRRLEPDSRPPEMLAALPEAGSAHFRPPPPLHRPQPEAGRRAAWREALALPSQCPVPLGLGRRRPGCYRRDLARPGRPRRCPWVTAGREAGAHKQAASPVLVPHLVRISATLFTTRTVDIALGPRAHEGRQARGHDQQLSA